MELSKTAYVILGMLKLGNRTGYEIKAFVEKSVRFFWAASYGQIYPELSRLEELGLVRGELDRSDGRGRKAYELTPEGEVALHAWLTSDAPLHFELRHEGVLKFFFSDGLAVEEQLEQLRRMREEHERVRDQLQAMAPADPPADPGHPLMTLMWGIAYQESAIDWCRQLERRLSQQAPERS